MNKTTDWLKSEEYPEDEPVTIDDSDYERYIKLKIAEKKIKQELKDLQDKFLEAEEVEYKSSLGSVVRYTRTTYQYSPWAKEKIAFIQDEDKKSGDAKEKETTIIKFTKPKGL